MKIIDAVTFGTAIHDRRKALGYTQSDLAAAGGVSVSFLSNLENGKATCELGKALYVANLLGLDCELAERG